MKMDTENYKIIDDKKFMWDGKVYESESEAKDAMKGYEKDNFEARLLDEDGKHLLYTRRVVTEVVVEGPPPT